MKAFERLFRPAFTKLGERLRRDAGWIRLGAALGCCGLLVHSFVEFNLHIPANAAWLAICVAIATFNLSSPHHLGTAYDRVCSKRCVGNMSTAPEAFRVCKYVNYSG